MFKFITKLFSNPEDPQLKAAIQAGAILVDVRTSVEFASGHVKGSINIPLDAIPSNLAKFNTNDAPIIVFCQTGNRSGKAKTFLEGHGYKNVINGGAWKDVKHMI